jgi:thiosulfate/3-mercaptopyruvate sulfurtransferase
MKKSLVFLLVIGSLLAGCLSEAELDYGSESYSNSDAIVDVKWLSEHLNDEGLRIIDLDAGGYFEEGHIEGALVIDVGGEASDVQSKVPGMIAPAAQIELLLENNGISNDDTVVVYDEGGNTRAARMYWVLKYYGHEDVRLLNGGKLAWIGRGFGLSKAEPSLEKTDYLIGEVNAEYRVALEDVLDNLDNPDFIILDVRSPEEYVGSTGGSKRNGHVPGAVNVDWRLSMNPDGTIKGPDELRELYRQAGVSPDKKIITYCRTGVRSAYSWFVLKELLGFPEVSMYDGSWVEWGNDPDVPIITGPEPR